jgi:hypothetical protein
VQGNSHYSRGLLTAPKRLSSIATRGRLTFLHVVSPAALIQYVDQASLPKSVEHSATARDLNETESGS